MNRAADFYCKGILNAVALLQFRHHNTAIQDVHVERSVQVRGRLGTRATGDLGYEIFD
ncbi:MAG: hypothetical protein ACYS0H_16405 [Planctomycetota bacterium]